jgi:hypothetical protein
VEDRQILIRDIAQARVEGARLAPTCALKAILDRGKHDAGGKSGRGKETARFGQTKKHQSAKQILPNLTDTTTARSRRMR